MATDAELYAQAYGDNATSGEFVNPSTIIKYAKQQGLSLVGRWTNRSKNLFTVPGFSYLNVCSLTFVKNA